MKVALITDTHWGVRNDAPQFMDMTKRFLDDVFFPRIKADGIRHAVHLGDLLDRRKFINFNVANRCYADFVLPMLQCTERFDIILGNHDVYHRNSNALSGTSELFRGFTSDWFRIYSGPEEVPLLDGTRALYLPWINPENHGASMDAIRQTRAPICFGHLELEGFEMYRGQVMGEEGLNPKLFEKFDVTCSGHFHHKSSRDGIHYLGSHGEFTWADYNDERGFHVFDTETRELEFVQNPYHMFEKVLYDEDVSDIADGLERVSGRYVKVIVKSRDDQVEFEKFISAVERCNPIDVQVVDDHLNAGDVLDSMDEVDESEDTLTIFRKALASSEFDLSKMDAFITGLYQEALTVE